MKNVLVVTGDTLGESMAGPAIRAMEISKALSRISKVKLASTVPTSLHVEDFEIIDASNSNFKHLSTWADVIVFQGAILSTHPWIAKTNKIIVADVYDPMHLELLEQQKNAASGIRYIETIDLLSVMNEQVTRADFLICASEKQRDFWLGQMAAMGRLNPFTYDRDNSLRDLIEVVPFGLPNEPPIMISHGIKGNIEGISRDDKVILWGGGIYNWFDPLTLIKAIHSISKNHPNIKLVFMGTQHPNPHVPEMKMSFRARELAEELGLTGKHVFFNEGWVPYNRRADFLLDADLGVSTHLDHLETAYSFRTRILDYLWAGLPIVATRGDTFEQIIEANNLGRVVQPENVEELSSAIVELLYSSSSLNDVKLRVSDFSKKLTWEEVLKPLVDFVSQSQRSPDQSNSFLADLSKWTYLGRRTLRQRMFVYKLNSKHNGFIYASTLVLKNALGKTYRKLKRILNKS